mgnify:CR=1 FL=1
MDRKGTFTPFLTSVDGLFHREAEHFLNITCMAANGTGRVNMCLYPSEHNYYLLVWTRL